MTKQDDALKPAGGTPVDGDVRPGSPEWVRAWFAEHYNAADVFYDSAEAITLDGAVAFAAAVAAAEREQCADALRTALTELRDRIKGHPAYANLTEEEEIETGGDTAELSYLARVADAALGA
jgi:hypothetical protein